MAKKEIEWVSNAFSRITALEGERVALRDELNIIREQLEKIEARLDTVETRPPGRLKAVQVPPGKADEIRRALAKEKRDQVLPG